MAKKDKKDDGPAPDANGKVATAIDGEAIEAGPGFDLDEDEDPTGVATLFLEGLQRVIDIAVAKINAMADEAYFVIVTPTFGDTQTFVLADAAAVVAKLRELAEGPKVRVRIIFGRPIDYTSDHRAIMTPEGPVVIFPDDPRPEGRIQEATFGGKNEPQVDDEPTKSGTEADDIAAPDDDADDDDDVDDDDDGATE
jgi:hypothetical protein